MSIEVQLDKMIRTSGSDENTIRSGQVTSDSDERATCFGGSTPRISTSTVQNAALVGTSLGGYWAAKFGNRLGIPAILINPTIRPQYSLKQYTGKSLLNFVTRTRNILHKDVPESYGDMESSGKFLVLLDRGDELLDYRMAASWFDSDMVICFDGGSHRFNHMIESLPYIRQFLSM